MIGIILAGGRGSRLAPLTDKRPKTLLPINGRPCMEYSIDLLKEHGITDIVVTTHYEHEQIVQGFGDGNDYGVSLTYSREQEPLGTAGSVRNVLTSLQVKKTIVVLSGDVISDVPLSSVLDVHQQKGALATIVSVRSRRASDFGLLEVNTDGKVTRFLEKPSFEQGLISTGIYVLEPEALNVVNTVPFDFGQDLFPRLVKDREKVYTWTHYGMWHDIGTLSRYDEAQRLFEQTNRL